MKRFLLFISIAMYTAGISAEGYETMANIKKQTYELTDKTTYTGDNGMQWTAVGAMDAKTGGYNSLAISGSVNGNGLSGNLTKTQTAEGVGVVTFYVAGNTAGTAYNNDRQFRVTAGDKSVVATGKVASVKSSVLFSAKVDATDASTLAITMLESVKGETGDFRLYNISWTSFSGKTDTPTFAADGHFVASGNDTTYYSADKITVNISCGSANSTIYYTTDGSEPSTSSYKGNSLTLGIGTHTVKAVAWTAERGLSEVGEHTYKVRKATITTYDASNNNAEGDYTTVSSASLNYTTLSGLPFYSLTAQHSYLLTDVVTNVYGLSLYAKNTGKRTLTVAYQIGSIVKQNNKNVWQAAGEWIDIVTLAEFAESGMRRFEIPLPAAVSGKQARFKLTSSGTTMYIDDIVTISDKSESVTTPEPTPEPIAVTGVSLSKTLLTLDEGATATLKATVSPADADDKTVTWTTSNAYVATVTSAGAVTAKAAGTATITVKTNDGGFTASCEVTVQKKVIAVTGVSLSKTSLELKEGESFTLKATVSPADAEDKTVTWTTSNANVATITSAGAVTAKAAGTATITVKTNDGGFTATCEVTVQKKVIAVTGVSLSETSLELKEGESFTLKATISPADAEDKSVVWTTSDDKVALVSNGTVKAVAEGTATITVKTNDGGFTATCEVTVQKKVIAVTGVSLSETSLELKEGESVTLKATISPADAEDKSVVWTTSDDKVALVSNGTVKAVAEGTATITVKTNDGGFTATCEVTVINPEPTEAAPAPVFSIEEGEVTRGTELIISAERSDDRLFVRIDGEESEWEEYEGQCHYIIDRDLTIEAYVERDGFLPSETVSKTYTVRVEDAVESVEGDRQAARKVLHDGHLLIIMPDGTTYTATGAKLN